MEKIHSVLSEIEDWEIPTLGNDQLELQMHTDDTEVFLGCYICKNCYIHFVAYWLGFWQ